MKKRLLIISVSTIVGLTTLGHGKKAQNELNDNTVTLDVILSSESCNTSSAIYQVMENGYSKVVDLQPYQEQNSMVANVANARKIYEVFKTMGLDARDMELVEHDPIDPCKHVFSFVKSSTPNTSTESQKID